MLTRPDKIGIDVDTAYFFEKCAVNIYPNFVGTCIIREIRVRIIVLFRQFNNKEQHEIL